MDSKHAQVTEEHRKLAEKIAEPFSVHPSVIWFAATAQLLADALAAEAERVRRETCEELARRYRAKGYRLPSLLMDYMDEIVRALADKG